MQYTDYLCDMDSIYIPSGSRYPIVKYGYRVYSCTQYSYRHSYRIGNQYHWYIDISALMVRAFILDINKLAITHMSLDRCMDFRIDISMDWFKLCVVKKGTSQMDHFTISCRSATITFENISPEFVAEWLRHHTRKAIEYNKLHEKGQDRQGHANALLQAEMAIRKQWGLKK